MKKFNLKDALAGKPVVLADGTPVLNLVQFPIASPSLRGVVNGNLRSFDTDGYPYAHYAIDGRRVESLGQAYMKSQIVTKWINLYPHRSSFSSTGIYTVYDTEKDANKGAGADRLSDQAFKIQYEE